MNDIFIKPLILIYTNRITSRLKYTFSLVFSNFLNIPFEITNDKEAFVAGPDLKISYCEQPVADELFFRSYGLLHETGISVVPEDYFQHNGLPAFFKVFDERSALPYDVFSAIFYMVSRYEEYMPYRKDEHGRFSAPESYAHRQGFLETAVVDRWILMIHGLLYNRNKAVPIKARRFEFIPTYDIDSATAYLNKGLLRIAGGLFRSLLHLDFEEFRERILVHTRLRPDPFDTFSWQYEIQKKYGLSPVYFVLLGSYSKFDKNISPANLKFRKLLRTLADYADVGIHPSYNSNKDKGRLEYEIMTLSAIMKQEVNKSRQHFLKLELPGTYRNLIKFGITEDYTMGFAAMPGFRTGTCTPYHFYDLDLEAEIPLKVYPFAFMEGTFCDYLQLSTKETWLRMKHLIDEVKAVEGTFISLWHNDSLSDAGRWQGWKDLYERMTAYAMEQASAPSSLLKNTS